MTPKLVEPGSDVPRLIPLHKEEFLIGRGSDCDLRLLDPDVSRHHCMFRVRPDDLTLMDLGSSNGTFVNGNRIFSQVTLQNGDAVQVGNLRFLIDLGEGLDFDEDQDSLMKTHKLGPDEIKKIKEQSAKKKENHPPGEAGGRGEVRG